MSLEQPPPPLEPLHSEDCLIQSKLEQIECLPTDRLVQCTAPAQRDCLKTRPDGTIIDGNHRVHVLRKRAVNVDGLPGEIILKEESKRMLTRFSWVDGGWRGRFVLSARPRGDDWLEDDLANWKLEGIDVVVSLLTPEEEENLGLKNEAAAVKKQNMDFFSFPIQDLQVPRSRTALTKTLEEINAKLSSGKNVVVHCRQGIGRTGMVSACLLVTRGWSPSAAVDYLSTLRGTAVPETAEQRSWIDHFAATLAGTK